MEFDTYYLYNEKKECVGTFGIYNDMKYFIENGINLSMQERLVIDYDNNEKRKI